jgi:hypothetical protein
MRAALQEIKVEVRRRMHQPIREQGSWLRQGVTGHFGYYAVPTNARALSAFRHYTTDLWRRTLRRRSQKDGSTWARMTRLADAWLPPPRVLHPWPRAALRRHTPKVGAGCSNRARPDRCGGRPAMDVPTATVFERLGFCVGPKEGAGRTRCEMAIDDSCERVGKVGVGVDVLELRSRPARR